jgi:hypothetical protein
MLLYLFLFLYLCSALLCSALIATPSYLFSTLALSAGKGTYARMSMGCIFHTCFFFFFFLTTCGALPAAAAVPPPPDTALNTSRSLAH